MPQCPLEMLQIKLERKECTTDGEESNKGGGLCGIETEEVCAADFHFHAF